ncbi:RNA polymerase sigma factor SigI [Bacillus sp. FJAT-27251]|uniref:RNA polymerase sigma factor SigI n=1 Tax=Bacillus sp. FJAT-27251 TaxID=1684142 RepID=UPI001E5C2575|nr:RNA polymerase sigma factor SigI [Bacillus sp. FJAT-27251]
MSLVLSLLFMAKKKPKTLEEKVALIQQGDESLLDDLIKSYKPFIAKSVSSVCKRYISETDDEFSIGLIAFNEAIQKFSAEKGNSLLSFADVLIKRKVIDYIRQQNRNQTVSFGFGSEGADEESQRSKIEDELSIENHWNKTDEERRRDEIYQFQLLLKEYDLSFQDLVKQSPKHADARRNAMEVARILSENEELTQQLLEKKRLPIKQLENMVSLSRKTIERNRKYIIAISLILIGDYYYLKDYIKGVLKE